jgi:glycosyltransferase involved in cell wall biosynthesis
MLILIEDGSDNMNAVVVIPALNPDLKLVALVREIFAEFSEPGGSKTKCFSVVVVNDGSDISCAGIFETLTKMGCVVLAHDRNMGKGAALKTGFAYVLENFKDACGVITADADGQHAARDILRVSAALPKACGSLVLGVRDFNEPGTPPKSVLGNSITSAVFRAQTGRTLCDTQTGLRGIPMGLLPVLGKAEGQRYEYEMNMLLLAHKLKIPFLTVPIRTIYTENNKSSHFHPVRDSARIYWDIIKFSCASCLCAALDFGLFSLLTAFAVGQDYAGITAASICARISSGALNFYLNKHVVFGGGNKSSNLKYLALFLAQMLVSSQLTAILAGGSLSATAAKLIVDMSLFVVSFIVQRKFIFKEEAAHDKTVV